MEHIYELTTADLEQPSMVTIGVFDGVHKGHQYLIRRLVEEAHQSGRAAVALTFFPHPDAVIHGSKGRYYLTTPEDKAELLGDLGVDYVITQSFDDNFRQIRAAAFVDMMRTHLKLDRLWVGSDFAMGYKREGNVEFLREQGLEKNFTVTVIDLIQSGEDHAAISSSGIREVLQEGNVEQARQWLGRAYALTGEVVHGDKRGQQIGFPTANVDVWEEQVIPANGVYAGWARLENGQRCMAVTNVGVRPTFNGQNVTVEAHLLDFNHSLYGQQLTVSFETRLRAEKRFNGVQELIAQIKSDAEAGRVYLSGQS